MATLQSTSTATQPDGSTSTTNTYSDGRVEIVFTAAAGSDAANLATLQQRATQALTTNATFQAIASPTNAQIAAQVQALTKECNGIIRLLLGALDATTGT